MRRTFLRSMVFAGLTACTLASHAAFAGNLVVAASEIPHAQILEFVKPVLAKQGVILDIKVFNDYVQPNMLLANKQVDANFFQHEAYLNRFNKDHGTTLVSVGPVHVEPLGAYSRRIKSLSELKRGAVVAIPNDPTNRGRALQLLQAQKLIKLTDPSNLLAQATDIAENPDQLKFREIEASFLPRALEDADMALINTNYAMEAGLVPTQDALFIEGVNTPYANVVATRQDNRDSPDIRKLMAALHTPQVRQFILDTYQGAIVPAF